MNVDGLGCRSGEVRNSSMEKYGPPSGERRIYGMSCRGTNPVTIRGLPSLELWVPTLPVVPVSSGRNQMVLGGSGGSGGSGDSEIVGFDWSYQSRIRKWYFVRTPCRPRQF